MSAVLINALVAANLSTGMYQGIVRNLEAENKRLHEENEELKKKMPTNNRMKEEQVDG